MPSLPEQPVRRKSKRPSYVGGYSDVVQIYLEQGWKSVLPLPHGQKWPPRLDSQDTMHDCQRMDNLRLGGVNTPTAMLPCISRMGCCV